MIASNQYLNAKLKNITGLDDLADLNGMFFSTGVGSLCGILVRAGRAVWAPLSCNTGCARSGKMDLISNLPTGIPHINPGVLAFALRTRCSDSLTNAS